MSRGLGNMHRIPERGVVAGVCAGIAEYFDWNVRLLRAILVVVLIFSGAFPILVIYGVLWYVMDPLPSGGAQAYSQRSFTEPAGASAHSAQPATMSDLKGRFARLEERLGHMEECVTSNEFELRRELKKLEA